MKPRKVTCYESVLLVEGRVSPMLDMMRYDACFPASEAEAGRMEAAEHRPGVFILRRRAMQPTPPTVDRWRSFGCRVLGVFDCVPDAERAREAATGESEEPLCMDHGVCRRPKGHSGAHEMGLFVRAPRAATGGEP